jgi:ribose transport system substrate-binding protein
MLHARNPRSVAALLSTLVLVAACGGAPPATPTAAPPAPPTPAAPTAEPTAAPTGLEGRRIAFLSQGATNEWAIQLDFVAQAAARETGAELLYFDAAGNADLQVTQMEDAQALNPDAIVITPLGAGALVGQQSRAVAAGIPVINCVTSVIGEDYTSFVGWDWAAMYGRAMSWMAEELGGEGNIIMLNGIAGAGTSDLAEAAAKEVLREYPGITIVGEGYSDWSIAKAKQLTETFLAQGVEIDGVYANGGEPAMGAIQAFADAGKPMPLLTGTSAQNGALRVLLEHDVKFFGIPSPPSASFVCIEIAARAISGEPVEKQYDMTTIGGFEDFTDADVEEMYKPQYADGYQDPTDQYLTEEELRDANLLRNP